MLNFSSLANSQATYLHANSGTNTDVDISRGRIPERYVYRGGNNMVNGVAHWKRGEENMVTHAGPVGSVEYARGDTTLAGEIENRGMDSAIGTGKPRSRRYDGREVGIITTEKKSEISS